MHDNLVNAIAMYLLAVNALAIVIYGIDKYKARKGRWRISESSLLFVALIGGALGAFIGMKMFRHKTRHWKFRILVPLLLMLWIAGIGYYMITNNL